MNLCFVGILTQFDPSMQIYQARAEPCKPGGGERIVCAGFIVWPGLGWNLLMSTWIHVKELHIPRV